MKNAKNTRPFYSVAALAVSLTLCSAARGQTRIDPEQPDVNDVSGKGTMTAYERFSQYPPESRPLKTSNWDLLHPWSEDPSTLPMIPVRVLRQADTLRAAGLPEEEALRGLPRPLPTYQFELERSVLTGPEDELRARLRVMPQGANAPPAFRVISAEMIGDGDFGSPHLGSVPFSCDIAGPGCTFVWRVPAAERQFWGVLELQAVVNIEGMADDFLVRQSFFSSPMVAGKFTGTFHERLENGSLVIDAGVKVQKRMACFLSANLFSIDQEMPTHHAELRLIVDPSTKIVSFPFFGKIFRDYGHEGAFRLQDLKGQCQNLAYPPEWFIDSLAHQAELEAFATNPPEVKEPTQIYFQYNNLSYTTRRYSNAVFSDREWVSPERTRKLEALRRAAESLNSPDLEQRKRQAQQQPQ